MLADEQRETPAGDRGADTGESERLIEEVRTELEAHDRRSEMPSPDPATTGTARRRRNLRRAVREEARRLRQVVRRSNEDR